MVSRAVLRYGGEWFDLFIALFITLFIVGLLSLLTGGLVCVWAVVGFVLVLIMSAWANSSAKKNSYRVTRESQPKVHKMCETAQERLEIGPTPVFIDGSREVNAYARGILSPMIVLHKGLVDILDDKELLFVIGHEMGHVKMKHTTITTIFESGMHRVPLIVYLPLLAFRLLFLQGRMSRSFEHSADRAGLYACEDIEAAVRAQLKLERGPTVSKKEVRKAISSMGGSSSDTKITDLLRTHPKKAKRIREMVMYAQTHNVGWPKGGF